MSDEKVARPSAEPPLPPLTLCTFEGDDGQMFDFYAPEAVGAYQAEVDAARVRREAEEQKWALPVNLHDELHAILTIHQIHSRTRPDLMTTLFNFFARAARQTFNKPLTDAEVDAFLAESPDVSPERSARIRARFDQLLSLQQQLAVSEEARVRLREELGEACPCRHTTPCHADCTCVNPVSSRGCHRCCSYGSKAQQVAMAEHLVKAEAARVRLQQERDTARAEIKSLEAVIDMDHLKWLENELTSARNQLAALQTPPTA